ncbi:MAG TPA: AMP-binding protein [Candidatus Babeliales bacterium]|nr:AMP-binding protein [Candidatus Babeliales bacterium]
MNKNHEKQSEQERFNYWYSQMHTNNRLLSVGQLLQHATERNPHKTALLYEDRSITYAELYRHALLFSKTLIGRGVKPRDRILIMIENSIEFYIAYFGILQIGAVAVPLNTFLQSQEVTHVLQDCTPHCIVISSHIQERLEPSLLQAIHCLIAEQELIQNNTTEEPDPSIHHQLDADELAVLLYTSGTTGTPKGIMLSSRNIMTNVAQSAVRISVTDQDRMFGLLPLFHSFAQSSSIWIPFFLNIIVIVVPKIDRRAISAGLSHNPTFFVGVPAVYGLLCLLRTVSFPTVRLFVSGGDALPDRIRIAFSLLYRRKICSGYGLTEASPVVTVCTDDIATATRLIGKPLAGITCRIQDEQGKEVEQGTIGELCIKGDNVMLGYYNAPEMTAQVLHDGWLKTGDLAYQDEEENLYITGRIKDLIIHKGLNIYPPEIENIILLHPNSIRVGVIGQADTDTGQIPIAYVQVKAIYPNLTQELKQLCQKNLAAYKVPREFICSVEPLPMTATGKVNKKLLSGQHANHNQ